MDYLPFNVAPNQSVILGSVSGTLRHTSENLDEAKQDNGDQSQQFGGGEQVLDLGGRFHADAVNKRQGGCGRHKQTGTLSFAAEV